MKKFYFLLAVLLVVIGEVVFASFGGREFKLLSTYYFGDNTDYEHPAQVAGSANGVVVAGRKKLQKFNLKGELEWTKPVYAFGSLCACTDSSIGICEKSSGEFYILDFNGNILEKYGKFGRIEKLKGFDHGSYGLQAEDGIYIYSGSNKKTYFIPSQPGDMIDFAYSDSNKRLAIVTLDSEVNCYLNLLTVTGEITSGRIVSEGLIFDVEMTDNAIKILKEDGIHNLNYSLELYSDSQLELQEGEGNGIINSCNFQDDLTCVGSVGGYSLWHAGERLFNLQRPVRKVFAISDGYLLLHSELVMVDTKGEQKKVLALGNDVIDIIKISNNSFIVVYSNKIEFYGRLK